MAAGNNYDTLHRPVLRPQQPSSFDRYNTNHTIGAIASGLAHLGPDIELGPHNARIDDNAKRHTDLVGVGGGAEGIGSPSTRNLVAGMKNAGGYNQYNEIYTKVGAGGVGRAKKGKTWLSMYGYKFILDPRSAFMTIWDLIIMIMLLFVLFLVPFEQAFVATYINLTSSEMSTTQYVFYIINNIFDAFFILDMVFQFSTAYIDPVTNLWVEDPVKIWHHYLKGWFLLDFVSVFPFENFLPSNVPASMLRFFKFARLLKMLRALKANRIVERMFVRYEINNEIFKICWNMCIIVVTFHLLVCMWRWTGSPDDPDSWMNINGCEPADNCSPLDIYLIIINQVVFMNEMDILLNTERFLFVVSAFCLYALGIIVVAEIIEILFALNADKAKFNRYMSGSNQMMREANFPKQLRFKMRQYFKYKFKNARDISTQSAERQQMLLSLSPQLLKDVGTHLSAYGLGRVDLFTDVPANLVVKLTMACVDVVYTTNERIYVAGSPAVAAYFIHKGRVMLDNRLIGAGGRCGEVALMGRPLDYLDSAVTVTYVSCLALGRDQFERVASEFPRDKEVIHKNALRSVMRHTIMLFARLAQLFEQQKKRGDGAQLLGIDDLFLAAIPSIRIYAYWLTWRYLRGEGHVIEWAAKTLQWAFRKFLAKKIIARRTYRLKTDLRVSNAKKWEESSMKLSMSRSSKIFQRLASSVDPSTGTGTGSDNGGGEDSDGSVVTGGGEGCDSLAVRGGLGNGTTRRAADELDPEKQALLQRFARVMSVANKRERDNEAAKAEVEAELEIIKSQRQEQMKSKQQESERRLIRVEQTVNEIMMSQARQEQILREFIYGMS